MVKPKKFKIHFNRINMQRGNPNVWTIHWDGRCIQVKNLALVGGVVSSVFKPEARQPRAYFAGTGRVYVYGSMARVEAL